MSSSLVQVTFVPALTVSSAGMNWNCLTVTALLAAGLAAVTVALATVVDDVDAAVSGFVVPASDPPQPARRTAATAPEAATRPRRRVQRIGSLVMPSFRTGACSRMKKISSDDDVVLADHDDRPVRVDEFGYV